MPTIRVKGAYPIHIILELQGGINSLSVREDHAEKLFITLKNNLPSTTFRRLITKMERYKSITMLREQQPWEAHANED